MDFNQILLFAGLGLLALVLLFALWGFLGGLKRELKCIAVFIVLLVLSWLVLGDAATILNVQAGQEVAGLLGVEDNSISTIWDLIVVYVRDLIPNGETLLVEGKETYDLLYSVAAALCHAVGLLVGTIVILVICPIIRLISHFVGLIIRAVKKAKAKKKGQSATTVDEAPKAKEQVVVPSTESGFEEAVLTKDKTDIEKKPAGKRRLWGAFAASLKGVFVVLLICAPLSGLSSLLNNVSPETRDVLNDLVNGKAEIKVSESNSAIDMVFDFAEAYDESALGKFANASGFFFGESFSEGLFDQLLKIETKTQTIYLTEELSAFVDAVNALNGKTDLSKLTKAEFSEVMEALKESKLVVELMPVAIEFAYSIEDINKLVSDANQEVEFLNLRYNNWRKDIDSVLDAVKEAYDLNLFPLSDFNYLTINPEELRDVVNHLGDTELMQKALPLGVSIALSMEQIQNMVGKVDISMEGYDVKKELNSIVDIYAKFQELGITSLEGLDTNALVKDILNDEELTNVVFEIVYDVIDLQLMEKAAVPLAFGFAKNTEALVEMLEKAEQYDEFENLEDEFTLEDLKVFVETVHIALELVDLTEYPTIVIDYFHFDADLLDKVVDNLFATEVTAKLFNIGLKVALSLDQVKDLTNNALEDVDLSSINWHNELKSVVEIYREFLNLKFDSMEDFKGDIIDLAQGILENDGKFNAVSNVLSIVAELQIYDILAIPAIQAILDKFIEEKFVEFSNILNLGDLSVEEWKADFKAILELARTVNELKVLDNLNPFDYTKLDIASDEGVANIKKVISTILNLNVLGNDELKTKLLMASIRQFDWTNLPENADSIEIEWSNEENVLLQLVDVYKNINDLEEFDIFNINSTDWVALIENDAFLDHVITAIETLIDSHIAMELMPGLLDKYLVPMLEGTDVGDDTLFTDILNNVQSEELANEIIKIITEIVKPALELNLLEARNGNLGAIDFANTDALKQIISGIFDNKLLQGFEGRVIRIILKLTGVLDIQKNTALYEELVNLDYTGEKEILLSFIDALAPVLKDPEFSIVDANGQLKLDLGFWTENETAKQLLEAVDVLFGKYGDETSQGSKLVETLMPSLYDKFVEEANLIPADFQELVDILEVNTASGAELFNVIQCLVKVLDELVKLNAQTLVNPDGGNMEISSEAATESFSNIIIALHDIELFKGHESEVLAWGVNYVAKLVKIDVEATVQDFSDVNWEAQQEVYIDIISDITSFLADNDIDFLSDLTNFIKNGKYKEASFITDENATKILNILDKVIDVEVIDAISPLFVKYAVKLLAEKGYDVSYINEFTNEELAHDFHKVVEIAHKLVEELDIVAYYNAKFAGSMDLPNEDVVKSLIDNIFELNIITKAEGRLANVLLEKLVESLSKDKPFFLTVEDFDAENIDWNTEKDVLKDIIGSVYDLLEVNNIQTMDDVQNLIKEKWYTYPTMLRDETGYVATELIRKLQNSQIVSNVIDEAYNYGIDQVNDSGMLPFDIAYLKDVEAANLIADLGTIADILDEAIKFGALRYIADQDIRDMDIEILAGIIEKLYELNVIAENEYELLDTIYNFAINTLENTLKGEFSITADQINSSSLENELKVIANVIRSLQGVLDAQKIEHSSDLEQILRDASYKQKEFFDEATFDALVEVVRTATDLQLVELLADQLVEFGINTAVDKGFNFSHILDGQYTTDLILEDLDVVLDIAKHAYDLGLMDYVFDKTLHTIEIEPLCNIVDELVKLNVANIYFHETLTKTINYAFRKLNINVKVTEEEFAHVTLSDEAVALKAFLHSAKDLLDVNELVSLDDILSFVNNKEYVKEEFFDVETGKVLDDIICNVVDSQTVKVLLPYLLNYGVDQLETTIDLTFLKDQFSGEVLAQDIKTITGVIVPAIEAGLVGIVFNKSIDELVLEFAKYQEILDVIGNVQVINEKYSYFAELGLNKLLEVLKIDNKVIEVECRRISFKSEVAILNNILSSLEDLANEKSLVTVADVKNLINAKLYQTVDFYTVETGEALASVLTNVADLSTLKVILSDTFDHYIQQIKGLDLSFLVGKFNNEDISEDIKTIAKVIVPAIEADAPKALFKEHYQSVELNFAKYDEILSHVGDLNIFNKEFDEIAAFAINKVLPLLKTNKRVESSDFEGISFDSEVDVLREALKGIEKVCVSQNFTTVGSIIEVINEKYYISSDFYTIGAGEGIAEFISKVVDSETVKVMLPRAFNFAVNTLQATINLTALRDQFTADELAEDIKSLAGIIVPAMEADLLKVPFKESYKEIVLNFEKYDEILDCIKDTNVLNKGYSELASLASNIIIGKLNIDAYYDPIEFAEISFSSEVENLKAVLNGVEQLAAAKQLVTVSDVLDVIEQKEYVKPAFYNAKVGEALANIVSSVVDFESLQIMLPDLLNYGIDSIYHVIDLTFLKDQYTGEEIASNVKVATQLVAPIIETGFLGVILGDPITEVEFAFDQYKEMLDIIANIDMINENYPRFASIGLTELLKALKVDGSATISECMLLELDLEIEALKAVIDGVEALCNEKSYVKVGDLKAVLDDKLYLDTEYYTIETGKSLETVLSNIGQVESLHVILADIFDTYITKVTQIDLSSLVGKLTGVELGEDIRIIAKLIVPAIEAELTNILDRDLWMDTNFHFDAYKEMVDIIKNMNLLNKVYPELATIVTSKAFELANIENNIDVKTFKGITFKKEAELAKAVLDNIENLFNVKGIINARNLRDLILDKAYMEAEFYDMLTGEAISGLIKSVVDVNTVKVLLPTLFNFAVDKASSIVNLSFLKDQFTAEELAEDVKTLSNLIVPAIEAGLNNLADRENIPDIKLNFAKYDEMLDIIKDVNIFAKSAPKFAELIDEIILGKLNVYDVIDETDCQNVVFADEIEVLKDVLNAIEQICKDKKYILVRDVIDAYNNKDYKDPAFYDVKTGEAIEAIISRGVESETVKVILPYAFDEIVNRISQRIDVSFLIGEFTTEELVNDIQTGAKLIVPAIELGVAKALLEKAYGQIAIDFDIYNEMLDIVKEMIIPNKKYAEFASLAVNTASSLANVTLTTKPEDFAGINFASEVELAKQILVGLEEFCVTKGCFNLSDAKRLVVENSYKNGSFYDLETGSALEVIISSSVDLETVKVMLPLLLDHAIKSLEISGKADLTFLEGALTGEELASDAKKLSSLIVPAIEAELVVALLDNQIYEYEIDSVKVDIIAMIVEKATSLNIIKYAPDKLILEAMYIAGIDTTDVDLSNIDWTKEHDIVVNGIKEVAAALVEYDLRSLSQIKDYLLDNINNISVKGIVSELKSIYNAIDVLHCVNVIELIDQSDLFDELFKPLYDKYVFDRVSGKLGDAADLTQYSKADLSDDIHSLAVVARSIYEIRELPGQFTESYNNPECISYVETIINELFSLNYLAQKKQALVELADQYIGQNIASIDLTNIDLAKDGQVIASFAEQYLLIYKETNGLKPQISQLGITELMSAVIEAYQGISETALAQEVVLWGFNQFILPRIADLPIIEQLTFTDDRVVNMYVEFGVVLEAMLDMGVFSNNGIDFTNKENTDRLFGIITKYFKLEGRYATVINKLKDNMYEFGFIPLSYAGVTNSNEINAYKDAFASLRSLYNNYKGVKDDFTILADSEFQAAVEEFVNTCFRSDLIRQVGPQMFSGLVKIFTKDRSMITLFEGLTADDYINVVLPEVFEMINLANDLDILNKKLDYKNIDGIIALIEAIEDSKFLEGHNEELIKFAGEFAGLNIKDKDFSQVNWEIEVKSLKQALETVKDHVDSIDLGNKSTLFNKDFLYAVADATVYFEESKLLPLIGREIVEFVANKAFGNKFDEYVDRLFDVTYTDEVLMNDYKLADEAIRALADTRYFDTGLDYNNLDPYIRLLEIFFELEYSNGLEQTVIEKALSIVSFTQDIKVDFSKVVDWDQEGDALVEVAKALKELAAVVTITNITPEDLHRDEVQERFVAAVDVISKSEIGRQVFPEIYEKDLKSKFGNEEYAEILDLTKIEPENWASEFEKLFEMYDIISTNGIHDKLTSSQITELVKVMFGDGEKEGLSSITSNPEKWFTKVFENNAVELPGDTVKFTPENVTDWDQETKNIVNVVEAMDKFQTEGEEFNYENVYKSNDAAAIEGLMNAVNETESLQSVMYQVVVDTAEQDSTLADSIENLELNGEKFVKLDELKADLADGQVDSSKWTSEQIALIAKTVADFNA